MSGELEAAGAMATAGLAAGAIEGREGRGAQDGACLNCGAQLSGPYCSQCGQNGHAHRTLAHLFEEVLHGLIHFDTKAWRTLPMLAFRPGTLTRNYIFGQRARYISPLALFLFTIFFMFFVFAFASPNVIQLDARNNAEQLADARASLAEAERGLTAAEAAGPDQYTGDLDVRLARQALELSRAEVTRREAALAREQRSGPETAQDVTPPPNPSSDAPANRGETAAPAQSDGGAFVGIRGDEALGDEIESGERRWQDVVAEAARNGELNVNFGSEEVNQRVLHSLENPDLALYKVQNAAYKFSFLLVPISLPFMWLLFLWRRGHTLYDHAVFTLYSLSFASLVFVIVALTANVPWLEQIAGAAFVLGLPVHMFFHLKGAYALGWWSALWRIWFLLLFAVLALSVFFLAILVLGLAG
jgi:hypothetical protein